MRKMMITGLECAHCNGDLHHALDPFDGIPRDEQLGHEDFYICEECNNRCLISRIEMTFVDCDEAGKPLDPTPLSAAASNALRGYPPKKIASRVRPPKKKGPLKKARKR